MGKKASEKRQQDALLSRQQVENAIRATAAAQTPSPTSLTRSTSSGRKQSRERTSVSAGDDTASRPRSSEGTGKPEKRVPTASASERSLRPDSRGRPPSQEAPALPPFQAWTKEQKISQEDLDKQKVMALKKRFRAIDTNGDGLLCYDEFSTILKRGDSEMSERELAMLFRNVDIDSDGFISFEEFVDYIFVKERLNKDDCIIESDKIGRKWTPVDEIRFRRLAGKDRKVSKEDHEFILTTPRSWNEAVVQKPRTKGTRRSLTMVEAPEMMKRASVTVENEGLDPADESELISSDACAAAAVAVQKSFRGVKAREEVQKKRCWQIYQAVEYQIEHEQSSMHDFLSRLIEVLPEEHAAIGGVQSSFDQRITGGWPYSMKVPSNYQGPVIADEFTLDCILDLMSHFAAQAHDPSMPRLHIRYVFSILVTFRQALKTSATISRISTNQARVITVIGDLHGQLRDLVEIFRRNGTPSIDNPYLFNGDLVDRGEQSLEVCLVIFGLAAASPGAVWVNRGNHEDMGVCRSYGFADEIVQKYGDEREGAALTALFGEIFSMLPLAAIIDEDVLVVHGGISNSLKLEDVSTLGRHRYQTLAEGVPPGEELSGYHAVASLLWSDPIDRTEAGSVFKGCSPNETRGIGTFWGADVTENWLRHYNLALMIRSHECVEKGFDVRHNGRVITVFSASNYYEEGSNLAAYCVLHRDRGVTIQQYATSTATGSTTFKKSVKKMEDAALEQLRHLLLARRMPLTKEFSKVDKGDTGRIPLMMWADIVQKVTDVQVPWISVHEKLVDVAPDDPHTALWKTCLAARALPTKNRATATGLYTNLRQMEAVFRLIDKDGSGTISVNELERAADVLNQAQGKKGHFSSEYVNDIIMAMDVDGDGVVNFNEFLEVMRNHELA